MRSPWTVFIPITLISLIPFLVLLTRTAEAHTLQNIKGEKTLLILDDQPVAVGDLFQVLDTAGVEKAQIQVRQIKEKRAIANIIKGELAPQSPGSYRLKPLAPPKTSLVSFKGYYMGYSQNQMSIGLTNSTTLSLSGTSFNLGVFRERALSPRIQVLARAGYESLQASGFLSSSACGGDCKVNIGYLSADALIKYSFYRNEKTWWLGGGLGFLLPVQKSSNVLDTSKLTISEKVLLGGGLHWFYQPQSFVPIQVEYSLQPSSNVVSTRQVILRIGYGTVF